MKKVNWSEWNSKKDNFKKNSHIKSRLIYGKAGTATQLASIVIITYKRAHGLKDALESALSQDYDQAYTITVLDDSGYDQETDDLMRIYCANYKNIAYYRNEKNLGQYANWNRACELSPTKWFCLLHDDDSVKSNYLTEVTKVLRDEKYSDIGLLGVYFDTIDNRKSKSDSLLTKLINTFTKIFVELRNKKPIQITLSDNIKLIYTLSCCLMINKEKVFEIGGLDDSYFPSADFILTSKMNYYHATVFLPAFLCNRGIGENESLKKEVCEDSIECAYKHTVAMLDTVDPAMSENTKKRKASFAAVAAEIGVLGYNNIDYSPTKNQLGMNKLYNSKIIRLIIMVRSRLAWSRLLFRNSEITE